MKRKDSGTRRQLKLTGSVKAATNVILFLLAVFAIYVALVSTYVGVLVQWLLALSSLFFIGTIIAKVNSLQTGFGMYLLGTKHGLAFIDRISKSGKWFWQHMSIWGLVLGLGIFSYPLLKGRISKWDYIFGLVSLLVVLFYILPALAISLQFINLPQLQNAVANRPAAYSQSITQSILPWIFYGVAVATGLAGYVVTLLVYNAGAIVIGIAQFVVSSASGSPQTSSLTNQLPGAAPIIPGIDIPLFAGIISLAILLIVHETSHGILARIEKIKLKGLGLVVFGIIPMGAYVEPDEKAVMKLDPIKQTRILAAGISSNFVLMFLFFLLLFGTYQYLLPGIYANQVLISQVGANTPAYGVLKPGMEIMYWNGYKINNLSSFTVAAANDLPGHIVTIATNTGNYSLTAKAIGNATRGIIGINVYQPMKTDIISSLIYFLFTLFSLSFLLNFAVAVGNLLPVPAFDGWRIYKANVKNEKIIRLFAYIIVVALVINILPLLFYAALG